MRDKREHIRHAAVLILAAAGLIICTTPSLTPSGLASAQATAPSWSYTGSLNTPRVGYTATLLLNGKVLVVGGSNADGTLASAELYDPSTGTWSPTGNLNASRAAHSATLLQNGKVLVAGGGDGSDLTQTAEIYDPGTGTWSLTGNLNIPRIVHTATLLSNGKVLFAGGSLGGGAFSATNTAELYDPLSGTWSLAGNLNGTRVGHTATLLRDGKVLVVGGCGDEECFFELGSAELFDPTTGTWSNTGGLSTSRYGGFTTTLLPNGNVLLAGGACCFSSTTLNSAHLYNPATGQWSNTGSLLSGRYSATATLLPSGQVLVAGGYSHDRPGQTNDLNSAELYDPATGTWQATASLNTGRSWHTATLLLNGKVLVVGHYSPLRSAELYDSGVIATPNPIDDPQFFVRQHYLDFLGRDPDPPGLAFWTNEITSCGSDAQCVEVKRVNVSAAFFLSIEFQETGFYAIRLQRAAFGRRSADASRLALAAFLPDEQTLGQNVVVGVGDWQGQLNANKQAYAERVAAGAEFTALFSPSLTASEYVAALYSSAGVTPTQAETDEAVAAFGAGGDAGRAATLRKVAESGSLTGAEFNSAFVLMEYFGYLRRDPDQPGYDFWLSKLNQFGGNYVQAEMVKAFLSSAEYRQRFGQP